jgi:hypothetical protein
MAVDETIHSPCCAGMSHMPAGETRACPLPGTSPALTSTSSCLGNRLYGLCRRISKIWSIRQRDGSRGQVLQVCAFYSNLASLHSRNHCSSVPGPYLQIAQHAAVNYL